MEVGTRGRGMFFFSSHFALSKNTLPKQDIVVACFFGILPLHLLCGWRGCANNNLTCVGGIDTPQEESSPAERPILTCSAAGVKSGSPIVTFGNSQVGTPTAPLETVLDVAADGGCHCCGCGGRALRTTSFEVTLLFACLRDPQPRWRATSQERCTVRGKTTAALAAPAPAGASGSREGETRPSLGLRNSAQTTARAVSFASRRCEEEQGAPRAGEAGEPPAVRSGGRGCSWTTTARTRTRSRTPR